MCENKKQKYYNSSRYIFKNTGKIENMAFFAKMSQKLSTWFVYDPISFFEIFISDLIQIAMFRPDSKIRSFL